MAATRFQCIDAHTCGNPVRVVNSSAPSLDGKNMSEKRQHFLREYDWIRTGLMFEPRGHDAMSGSILYPPTEADGDLGILFIEVSGCLPMCGHGTIGTVTVAVEEGLVDPVEPGVLQLDTPAGRVVAHYEMDGPHVDSVRLTNVPSFVHSRNLVVEIPSLGSLTLDISYGGNFYAIVEPQENYPGLEQFSVDDIRRFSPLVRAAVNDVVSVIHPENPSIRDVSHVMWTDEARDPAAHKRNAVFYGDRGIDRSPCGTGTSARLAQLVGRDEVPMDTDFVHESIIGSLFTARAISRSRVGDYQAITPTVTGWARITGYNEILIDDRDPFASGFLLT